MGVSTDGILCYGIPLDPEEKLPWEDDQYEGDFDTWFEEKYPGIYKAPAILVRHCSESYPMHIMALPGTYMMAWRGQPSKIEPFLMMTLEQNPDKVSALIKFVTDNKLPVDGPLEPAWYLASYWG